MAHHLLRTTPDLHMVVTDFDPDMVSTASENLRKFGSRAMVQQADANDLSFADDRFDFVISCLMLHHTGDWQRSLREAIRVLRPGGRLVGFDIVAGAPLHHSRRFATLMRQGQLSEFLTTVPVTQVLVRPGLVKSLVRFVATKAA